MFNVPLRWISAAAALVLIVLPRPDGILQHTLEQALFVFLVAAAAALTSGGRIRLRYAIAEHGPAPLFAAAALFAQGVLGGAVHAGKVGVMAHAGCAIAAIGLVIWAGVQTMFRDIGVPELRRSAMLLLSLTFSQLLLGMGAFMYHAGASSPQPDPRLAWFTVAHSICGSLTLAAAVILAVLVYGRMRPEDAELAHGGVAIA
jgi:heme A synthase